MEKIASIGIGQFYAIEYVDNPIAPSLYRKYRAAIIDDDIFVTHVHFGDHWNVHRTRDPDLRRRINDLGSRISDSKKLLDDSSSHEAETVYTALKEIRKKIPLDLFGIDFDVMADGRILFFEANAAMNLSFSLSDDNKKVRLPMRNALKSFILEKAQRPQLQ